MFSFLHAADIHLDSPLKGLEEYQDAPMEQIREAARKAFDNLVQLAIDETGNKFEQTIGPFEAHHTAGHIPKDLLIIELTVG